MPIMAADVTRFGNTEAHLMERLSHPDKAVSGQSEAG
jgi:hypothetical protein